MTSLCKWCVTLVVCTFTAIQAEAQTVAITSSQEIKAAHKMDQNWLAVADAMDMDASILPVSFLSDSDLRTKADIIIISSGLTTISPSQSDNLTNFLKAGGSIYVQSEYLSNFDVNVLFKTLITSTGGAFNWTGHLDNNLGPVNLITELLEDLSTNELDYFWYGAYGCGDAQVLPIMGIENTNLGFFYRNENTAYGNLVTQSDHDWIRTIDDTHTDRKALMTNLLTIVNDGVENFESGISASIEIDEDVNFCTATVITAEVSGANDSDIQWYVNGTATVTGASIAINTLNEGDEIYAAITVNNGCGTEELTSEEILYTLENHTPNRNTTLSGNATACPGTTITIQADYDQSLPQLRHNWFLNGQDTPTNTDYYASDDLQDGDILEHSLSYFDGCTMVDMPTDQTITVAFTSSSNPTLTIEGTSTFCTAGGVANLSLSSVDSDDYTVEWFLDGVLYEDAATSIQVTAANTNQEVKATVKYNTTCAGSVMISATTIVEIADLEIETLELGNIDCENPEGFIEVDANGSDITYKWSNGATGNYLNNLSVGTYTVTATSTSGCSKTENFEITSTVFPLLDSLNIIQPSCNEGNGIVDLYLADNPNTVTVQWINTNNEVISTDDNSNNLPAGKYTITLDVNGNCKETYNVEIIDFNDKSAILVDTIYVDQLEEIKLEANTSSYENYRIEWIENAQLSCTNCNRPTFTALQNTSFDYFLVSPEGCKVQRRILVIVDVKDPYFAPSAFSPNNDGMNDTYKIHTRADVHATSNLMIFDRWGSLIHEDTTNEGWDGKSFGQPIQKGIFVFVQEFEDTLGNTYMAKGSITVL